jgi:cytochrome c
MNKICIAIMMAAGLVLSVQARAADESALAKAKNCTTCHSVDKKIVGPAYKDVAAKYTAKDTALLTDKVIKGGSGVWGAIPMTPNAAVTKDEATRLVQWILSLK